MINRFLLQPLSKGFQWIFYRLFKSLGNRLILTHLTVALFTLIIVVLLLVGATSPLQRSRTYDRLNSDLVSSLLVSRPERSIETGQNGDQNQFNGSGQRNSGQRNSDSANSSETPPPTPSEFTHPQTSADELFVPPPWSRTDLIPQLQTHADTFGLRILLVNRTNDVVEFDSTGFLASQSWHPRRQSRARFNEQTSDFLQQLVAEPKRGWIAEGEDRWLFVSSLLDPNQTTGTQATGSQTASNQIAGNQAINNTTSTNVTTRPEDVNVALVVMRPEQDISTSAYSTFASLPAMYGIIVFFLLIFLVILLSIWIANIMSRSLNPVITGIQEIGAGNFDYRVVLDADMPTEFSSLAHSFNQMAQEVQFSRQAQRDFIANVGHDLRTPLTSIQGFSQALLDGTASDEKYRQRAATIIFDEANRLTNLVDEILALARLESTELTLDLQIIDLNAYLANLVEDYQVRSEESNIKLEWHPAKQPYGEHNDMATIYVALDTNQFHRVLTNLLNNALKFTSAGGRITISTKLMTSIVTKTAYPPIPEVAKQSHTTPKPDLHLNMVSSPTNHSPTPLDVSSQIVPTHVEISVTDTGPGIPPDDLPRIFDRFYQVEKSRAGRKRGTGLGLAIVKELVNAHNGELGVESALGRGSRFWVQLPLVNE
ncbi:MAG: HAMP domain-containing sensor histidine kinase [Chloroflexota bacterium]